MPLTRMIEDATRRRRCTLENDSINSIDADSEATATGFIAAALAFSGAVDQDANADGTATTDTRTAARSAPTPMRPRTVIDFSFALASSDAVSQEVGDDADTGTATVTNDYQYDPDTGELIEDSGSIDADATAYADGSVLIDGQASGVSSIVYPADTALAIAIGRGCRSGSRSRLCGSRCV